MTGGCHGVLIAGGASRRMGVDKRTLRIPGGETLLERAHARLRAAIGDVVCLVEPGFPREAVTDASLVEDRTPEAGPLTALIDFARQATGSWLLVLGTDTPNVPGVLLRRLLHLSLALPDPTWCLIPAFQGRDQPLTAVYGTDFLKELARRNAPPRSFRQGLCGPDARVVRAGPSALEIVPSSWTRVFWNVNRPEEWHQWKDLRDIP